MTQEMDLTAVSRHLCRLLRHEPELARLHMDEHGWVEISELLENFGRYPITRQLLDRIVQEDDKGRYRISPDGTRIKCCQGHSIPWVQPELEEAAPPAVLYHGTTAEATELILESGRIDKMGRHHVHMHGDISQAWRSARRRKGKRGVLLVIDAEAMAAAGFRFYRSENDVWFADSVPTAFIREICRD